jgi:transcriptional regulator with XRE-family HTH domain
MPYFLRDQPESIELVIVHFGVDVRMSRLMRFETQTHLSDLSGISQSTWSMIENGLAEGVRLELLARVAASMRLDIVLRPCQHPPGTGQSPPTGRIRRLQGATPVPGTRRLIPGPGINDR